MNPYLSKWQWTLTLKNGRKRSFSYETKALMLFILIRRMSLKFPIMKKKRLLCESVFVLIDRWNLILKNGGRKSFLSETKALITFIPIKRMRLWFLIMERKEIIMQIRIYPNWLMKFDSKKWWEEKQWNQSINNIYPNEENVFMMPNQEMKWDYCVNLCLSQLKDVL